MVFFRPIIAGVFLAESLVGVIELGDFVGGDGGVVVLLGGGHKFFRSFLESLDFGSISFSVGIERDDGLVGCDESSLKPFGFGLEVIVLLRRDDVRHSPTLKVKSSKYRVYATRCPRAVTVNNRSEDERAKYMTT